jgi:hypothetical protein
LTLFVHVLLPPRFPNAFESVGLWRPWFILKLSESADCGWPSFASVGLQATW